MTHKRVEATVKKYEKYTFVYNINTKRKNIKYRDQKISKAKDTNIDYN